MQEQDIIKYCNLMDEIKHRTAVITAFGSGGSATPYKATTIESVCLQFRKILELIAFGSLIYHLGSILNRKRNTLTGFKPWPKNAELFQMLLDTARRLKVSFLLRLTSPDFTIGIIGLGFLLQVVFLRTTLNIIADIRKKRNIVLFILTRHTT